MRTHFVEVTNNEKNWGKFMLAQFEREEWERPSQIHLRENTVQLQWVSLLTLRGWDTKHIIVFDLETCEGAAFRPGGSPKADLNKHRIWVCPMFEPFLEWLYAHPEHWEDVTTVPSFLDLQDAPFEWSGYRRPGPEEDQ